MMIVDPSALDEIESENQVAVVSSTAPTRDLSSAHYDILAGRHTVRSATASRQPELSWTNFLNRWQISRP